MATAFDTPVYPFGESFADLPNQWLEASTRAISASAELYTEVLNTHAEATRALLEAYGGLGTTAARPGAQTTEEAADATTTQAARTTARSTRRTTRRAAGNTRRAAGTARRATQSAQAAAAPQGPQAPIVGYDDLTAEEVVAKLAEQPQTALAEIAAYESAKEKRATVLQRVAALTGPEPAPDYDGLNTEDAVKLVTNGSPTLAAAVRDYERRHKDRASVVEAATRHADAKPNADAEADGS